MSVAAAIEEFLEAAEDGRARNRSGRRYMPSALRDLRGCLRGHVARDLGDMALRDVRRQHIQALVDRLAEEQLSVSRIRSVISAVRALYGYAIERGYVEFSPANGLVIPRDDEPESVWDEHPPLARDGATVSDSTSFGEKGADWSWTDHFDEAPEDDGVILNALRRRSHDGSRRMRTEPPPDRRDSDYQPIALLPERILSLVLRIVVVVFILFALFTITESV
jgi:hypothetical protein